MYMSLGSYTFRYNPSIYAPPELMTPLRRVASVETYDSVAVFSWGLDIAGKKITLKWNYLPQSQYAELTTLYSADTSTVFDPNDGSGSTYNVEIMSLVGSFHYKLNNGSGDVWRSNVSMELLVLSEVV